MSQKRNLASLNPTLWAILCALCFMTAPISTVQAENTGLETLKVDATSAFPKARIYVQTPDATWANGTAEYILPDTVDQRVIDDITKEPGEGDAALTVPVNGGSADVFAFEQQEDSEEALLVIFAIDTSGSMKGRYNGQRRLTIVKGIIETAIGKLRSIDKVAIVAFEEEARTVQAATSNHQNAIEAAKSLKPNSKPGLSTFIYDAIAHTINDVIRPAGNPSLPGRRIIFVFSDGENGGGNHTVETVIHMLEKLKPSPTVVSIGIGNSKFRGLRDMSMRLSELNGSFMANPTNAQIEHLMSTVAETMNQQVLLEFELPKNYWTEGTSHLVSLTLKSADGVPENLKVQVKVGKLDDAQKEAGTNYKAALNDRMDSIESAAKTKKLLIFGAIGLFVLIVLILVLRSNSRKRREKERFAEEQRQEEKEDTARQMAEQEQRLVVQMQEQAQQAAEAARVVLASLVAMDGPLKGQRFDIKDAHCMAGRDAEHCALHFPPEGGDIAISRVHAEFRQMGGSWQVSCLSDGGLWVNQSGLRKGDQYPIQFGDNIVMGKTSFRFGPA